MFRQKKSDKKWKQITFSLFTCAWVVCTLKFCGGQSSMLFVGLNCFHTSFFLMLAPRSFYVPFREKNGIKLATVYL